MLLEAVATLLIALTVVAGIRRLIRLRTLEKIPGPPALPLVGNALDLWGSRRDLFVGLMSFCSYGEGIVRAYLGLHPVVVLSKAKYAQVVLNSTSVIDKGKEYEYLKPWLGEGLITSTGSKWHSRRKLLTPTFYFKILENFVDVFNHQSKRLLNIVDGLPEGKPFDIFPLITRYTLDVIMESTMGMDINVQKNTECDYVKAVHGIAKLTYERMFLPWIQNDLIFKLSGREKQHRHYLSILHDMSLTAITRRREEYRQAKSRSSTVQEPQDQILGKKKRLAFLDLLLEESEQSDTKMTNEDIREEVDTVMFAGHDTTASSISFALYFLGRHHDIQERVYEELMEVIGSSEDISMEQLKELKLLECCMKESLRLCPAVPLVTRNLTEPLNIDGYEIPENTSIILAFYEMHRDPEQFPDPETFNPDRFLPDEVKMRHPYAFTPFSAGPRNCIGQRFAFLEEKMALASLLRHYRITASQDIEDMCLIAEIILRPEKGITVTMERRV